MKELAMFTVSRSILRIVYRLWLRTAVCMTAIQENNIQQEAFYEWMNTRKNKLQYTSLVELLLGNIRESAMPAFRHQNVRGNLYFAIKSYLKREKLPYQLCFCPYFGGAEETGSPGFGCVADLFLISSGEVIYDNIYRGVPQWIIEIVTPATATQDYIDKAQLYQYHGVGEY